MDKPDRQEPGGQRPQRHRCVRDTERGELGRIAALVVRKPPGHFATFQSASYGLRAADMKWMVDGRECSGERRRVALAGVSNDRGWGDEYDANRQSNEPRR